jgi:putative glycosyltransferase (TIGR04348 family)
MPVPRAPSRSAVIVTPAPRGRWTGNRVTAVRWAGMLRRLGLRVRVVEGWHGEPCDLLVAVHAVKSAASVLAAAAALPGLRVVVVLAGTDIYPHFEPGADTAAALARADVLITLQHQGGDGLPSELRRKVRTIVQSATAVRGARAATPFRACVLAHLRPVKDPLLPVQALAHVPSHVAIELVLAGRALSPETATAVTRALQAEPRARWLGELPRRAARALLATSHACIVPSMAEGGANVLSEALAATTPLLASAVAGNIGLLGASWPALFPAGDARGLGLLLARSAADGAFYQRLVEATLHLQPLVAPGRELAALARLLADLDLSPGDAASAPR